MTTFVWTAHYALCLVYLSSVGSCLPRRPLCLFTVVVSMVISCDVLVCSHDRLLYWTNALTESSMQWQFRVYFKRGCFGGVCTLSRKHLLLFLLVLHVMLTASVYSICKKTLLVKRAISDSIVFQMSFILRRRTIVLLKWLKKRAFVMHQMLLHCLLVVYAVQCIFRVT